MDKLNISSSDYSELSAENNYWMKVHRRILDVVLLLSVRGLSFFGTSNHIGDPENGNFLGISELLSKYDPLLSEYVEKVHQSIQSHKRLQINYLSTRIQNKLIDFCGSLVQTAIVNKIHIAKPFSIIIKATPDCSHKEKTIFIMQFLKLMDPKCLLKKGFSYLINLQRKVAKILQVLP